jgi:hypothetical protein
VNKIDGIRTFFKLTSLNAISFNFIDKHKPMYAHINWRHASVKIGNSSFKYVDLENKIFLN